MLRDIGGDTLDDEVPVQVGGIAATRYDIGGTGGEALLVETPVGEFTTDPEGEAARLTLLEVEGTIIAIVEIGAPDDPTSSWTETQIVIDTIAGTIDHLGSTGNRKRR
jgi:hypothetical protein